MGRYRNRRTRRALLVAGAVAVPVLAWHAAHSCMNKPDDWFLDLCVLPTSAAGAVLQGTARVPRGPVRAWTLHSGLCIVNCMDFRRDPAPALRRRLPIFRIAEIWLPIYPGVVLSFWYPKLGEGWVPVLIVSMFLVCITLLVNSWFRRYQGAMKVNLGSVPWVFRNIPRARYWVRDTLDPLVTENLAVPPDRSRPRAPHDLDSTRASMALYLLTLPERLHGKLPLPVPVPTGCEAVHHALTSADLSDERVRELRGLVPDAAAVCALVWMSGDEATYALALHAGRSNPGDTEGFVRAMYAEVPLSWKVWLAARYPEIVPGSELGVELPLIAILRRAPLTWFADVSGLPSAVAPKVIEGEARTLIADTLAETLIP